MPQEIAIPESAATLRELRHNATLEKLARDWNITATNQAEQNQLLEMAAYLRAAKSEAAIKTAADQGNPFLSGLLDNLKGALRSEGFQTGLTSEEALFKEAAHNLIFDHEEIAKAGLEWAEYLAKVEAAA